MPETAPGQTLDYRNERESGVVAGRRHELAGRLKTCYGSKQSARTASTASPATLPAIDDSTQRSTGTCCVSCGDHRAGLADRVVEGRHRRGDVGSWTATSASDQGRAVHRSVLGARPA
jgi:hypothetical protein